jgi:hypothetical protein
VNIAGGNDLSETGLISTTAIAAASNSASTIYSTTARTSVAYRVLGYIESTQATAGTWAATPSLIQGVGGQSYVRPSSGSMVRLNTGNGHGSTNTCIRRFTNTVLNQGSDITYADSATLGASFTINASGVYEISYVDNFSVASNLGLTVNSSQLTTAIPSVTIADVLFEVATTAADVKNGCSCAVYLAAGAVVRAHTAGATGGVARTFFTITRLS